MSARKVTSSSGRWLSNLRRRPLLATWSARRLGLLLISLAAIGLASGMVAARWHFDSVERLLVSQRLSSVEASLNVQRRAADALGRRAATLLLASSELGAPPANASSMQQLRDRLAMDSALSWLVVLDAQRELRGFIAGKSTGPILSDDAQATLLAALASQGAVGSDASAFYLLLDGEPMLVSQTELKLAGEGMQLLLIGQPVALGPAAADQTASAAVWQLQKRLIGSPADRAHRTTDLRWTARARLPGSDLDIVVSQPAQFAQHQWLIALWLVLAGLIAASIVLVLYGIAFKRRVSMRLQSLIADAEPIAARPEPSGSRSNGDEIDRVGSLISKLLAVSAGQRDEQRRAVEVDPLTGLGNRSALLAALESAARADARPTIAGVRILVMIDIGEFALLNDGVGHRAGDQVLLEFANRIGRALGPEDFAARTGADEFCVLLTATAEQADSFCEGLRLSLAVPIRVDSLQMALGVSMGMAAQRSDEDAEQWLRNAEMATHSAKRLGVKRPVHFEPALRAVAQRRLSMEQDLRKAIEARTIETWFQPIVDGRTGAVVGLEALARWRQHDEYVSPAEFIGIAESTGMIVRLGQIVLSSTCEMLARLRKVYPGLTCSLNISVRQFIEGDLQHDLSAALELHGLPPAAIPLEVTESQVAAHEALVLEQMNALTARGMRFYLDDFGVGLSSLGRLRLLPVHALKIDRSFVQPLESFDDPMVGHIVALAHDLGLKTIAEGVETESARARLVQLGCYDMQGFLLSRPMTEGALWPWLEHRVVGPSSIAA